jgi:CubicO group peptidase (beta-lactamase class C family)
MKIALFLAALPLAAASIQETKPEDVGLSTERLRRIHETMRRHMDAHQISGAVTLVVRRGRIAHLEAHGLMDVDSKKPMDKHSIFRVYSMSKPVTGVAILMLMEEGKVRLNDPVSKFIPEFNGMKVAAAWEGQFYTMPASRDITIQDVLTHVSGLASGGPASAAELSKIPRNPREATLADYIPRLGTTPLDFQPGSRWRYSPEAGFDTLGRIVEIASGQTFDRFLKERIFDPLGMKDTFFRPTEEHRPRAPTAYHRSEDALQKAQNQYPFFSDRLASATYFSGAGGLMASAEDGSGANSDEVRYRLHSAVSLLSIGIRQRAPRSIVLT